MKTHRIAISPDEKVEIVLSERLENGYVDEHGHLNVTWQDRDAPPGQIAKKGRELQVEVAAFGGKVGPVVVTHR